MARVTVEDCIDKIPNRFELVMIASQRARDIAAGAPLTVERDNDKNPVVALREVAEEKVDFAQLQNSQIQGLQRHVEYDEPEEEDVMELLRSEQQIGGVDLEQKPAEEGAIVTGPDEAVAVEAVAEGKPGADPVQPEAPQADAEDGDKPKAEADDGET